MLSKDLLYNSSMYSAKIVGMDGRTRKFCAKKSFLQEEEPQGQGNESPLEKSHFLASFQIWTYEQKYFLGIIFLQIKKALFLLTYLKHLLSFYKYFKNM